MTTNASATTSNNRHYRLLPYGDQQFRGKVRRPHRHLRGSLRDYWRHGSVPVVRACPWWVLTELTPMSVTELRIFLYYTILYPRLTTIEKKINHSELRYWIIHYNQLNVLTRQQTHLIILHYIFCDSSAQTEPSSGTQNIWHNTWWVRKYTITLYSAIHAPLHV